MLAAELDWLLYKGKKSFADNFASRNFEKVIYYFNALLEIDPTNGNAHRILGLIYKLIGEYDSAVRHLERAIYYYNKDVEAYVLLGQIQGNIYHQHEKAIEYLNKALTLRPKHYLALQLRGYNKGQLGQHDEATADLNEAISYGNNLDTEETGNAYFYRGQNKIKKKQKTLLAPCKTTENIPGLSHKSLRQARLFFGCKG